MPRATTAQLRAAIVLLTANEPGMAVDSTCTNCGYPELSARVKWPEGVPLGVVLCRKCGDVAAVAVAPKPPVDVDLDLGIG